MKQTDFAKMLTRYLTDFLPEQRNVSPNTIKSYRDTFKQYLMFMQEEHGIRPERIWEKSWNSWIKQGYQTGKDPLFRILYNNSLRNRDHTAIIYYGKVITWDELRDLIMRAAGGLQQMGVKKGDRYHFG